MTECVVCSDCPFVGDVPSNLFEIHVTVVNLMDDAAFKNACYEIGVKPILIEMDTNLGVLLDLMTSSKFIGTYDEAYDEMMRIDHCLTTKGYNVIRTKIEASPTNLFAPSIHNDIRLEPNQYFESHLAIHMKEHQREEVGRITKKFGLHISRNAFKKNGDNHIVMATLRWYDGKIEVFTNEVRNIVTLLRNYGYVVDKEIIEFAIYDSHTEHDRDWIKG